MRIELQIPIEMGEYELPEFASMAGLPLLESKLGKFNWQKEDAFFLYVGDMDKVEYDSYKDRCVDAGFVNEVNEGDVHYTAINDNGYKLSLSYEGYNTIKVELHCPENKEEIEQSKTTTESMTTIEITTNINENTEEMTISLSQYNRNKKFWDTCKKEVVVMEDNGQYEYKRLG